MAAKKKTETTNGEKGEKGEKKSRAPARRKTPRKQKAGTAGLAATDVRVDAPPELVHEVEGAGGSVIGAYREPLGGHPLIVAVVPIESVEPTPFQRDLSDAHHKRLAEVIAKTGQFLDPIIAVTAPPKQRDAGGAAFWTPNGRHRLAAMQRLGAKAITVLLVPDRKVAWQILALNTEKAHNLKERALEVVRIYRGLIATEEDAVRAESGFALYLEDPALVTLGVCYEKNPRFAGGAYHPVLRRVLQFADAPIADAVKRHERLADETLAVEAAVALVIEKLRARGFQSPYLRSFVVSRINPLRWIQGDLPPAEKVLETMKTRAEKFDVGKVKQEDLAKSGGIADEE